MRETGKISARRISDWTGRCLVFTALVAMIGCAQDYGRDSSGTGAGSTTDSNTAKAEGDQRSATATSQTEDVRFVATEEQNTKMWKASGPASAASGGNTVSLNLKNRGSKPLTFKVVNMLSAEHGFAIDSMKVQTVLKPGEERTITVPLENIDPTATEHRVYCQLHPKHMAAALIVMKDQEAADTTKSSRPADSGQSSAASDSTRSQTGEASSQISGESQGQKFMRERTQQQNQVESTSRTEQAPGSIEQKGCEGFPGFDRGCPGGGATK
jgi:hypothetical protein